MWAPCLSSTVLEAGPTLGLEAGRRNRIRSLLWEWPGLCQCFHGLKTTSPHLFQIQTVRILTQLPSRASLTPWTLTLCCGRHSAACGGSGRQGGAPAPTFILKYKRQKKNGERDEIFNKMKKEKNLFYNQYLRRMGHWPSTGAVQASGSPGLAPDI